MLRWRLLLGTLIILAIAGLCWLDWWLATATGLPGLALLPLMLVFVVLATAEVIDLARAAGVRPVAWAVHGGTLLVACSSYIALWEIGQWFSSAEWTLLAIAAALLIIILAEMLRYERPGGVMASIALSVFSIVYVGVLITFVVQLRMLWGLAGLASLLIVVKSSDIGAYTLGKLIGRHKLAPVLSPGKTVEGAIGAILFGCLAAWGTFLWLETPDRRAVAGPLLFGAALTITGMIGDLAESLLKRDVARKDSSTWLPGFGGVLDILDSVLFAAPAAYACWKMGIVGLY